MRYWTLVTKREVGEGKKSACLLRPYVLPRAGNFRPLYGSENDSDVESTVSVDGLKQIFVLLHKCMLEFNAS